MYVKTVESEKKAKKTQSLASHRQHVKKQYCRKHTSKNLQEENKTNIA
jgi:hypothetical protein